MDLRRDTALIYADFREGRTRVTCKIVRYATFVTLINCQKVDPVCVWQVLENGCGPNPTISTCFLPYYLLSWSIWTERTFKIEVILLSVYAVQVLTCTGGLCEERFGRKYFVGSHYDQLCLYHVTRAGARLSDLIGRNSVRSTSTSLGEDKMASFVLISNLENWANTWNEQTVRSLGRWPTCSRIFSDYNATVQEGWQSDKGPSFTSKPEGFFVSPRGRFCR